MTTTPGSGEILRPTDRLAEIEIDEGGLPPLSPERDQERRVAVFDLLEENSFALPGGPDGPYRLRLGMEQRTVSFDLTTAMGSAAGRFTLSLGPLDQAVKDYGMLCDSYAEAIKSLPPAQIETIDRARRDIHAESAQLLRDRLSGKALIDRRTARHLFTLICVLVADG